MLGPPKIRDLDRPVLISLESYVPRDHFFRHLHRELDLSFVRDLVADCYASGGRPSIDPEVFFRLHLIMFFSRAFARSGSSWSRSVITWRCGGMRDTTWTSRCPITPH